MSSDGVQWLERDGEFDLGYWVVFARGLEPAELVARTEAEPDPMTALTRIEASDLADETDDVVLRAGSAGGWAFGVVEGGPVGDAADTCVRALSVGTEAVGVWRTVNADTYFEYAEDGRTVCCFEPGREHERKGDDPGRLLPALREAGLVLPDGSTPFEHGADVDEPMLRVLRLAESAFGLGLPRHDVLDGALLAARIRE